MTVPIGVEDFGDLLVGEPLDIGEIHGEPEPLWELVESRFHLVIGEKVHQFVLGAAPGQGLLDGADAPVEVEVFHLGEVGLVRPALLGGIG